MYPAAELEDLDEQIAVAEELVKVLRLMSRARQSSRRLMVVSTRLVAEERALTDLQAERARRAGGVELLRAAEEPHVGAAVAS
jgi:hypothetical protein